MAAVRDLGYYCGLVTGNLEEIAYIKLDHYHLTQFFADHVGGFGSDHRDRVELIRIAIQRAAQVGFHCAGQNVIYIADTPLDVHAARGAGVHCVITTTGIFRRGDFVANPPDLVVDDLSHQAEIFNYVDELQASTIRTRESII